MGNWLSCCVEEENVHQKSLKKSIQEYKKANSGFVNLHRKTDSDKIRHITQEIAKLGKDVTCDVFTFRELCVATQNFSLENLIGQGGFGRVYKGHIERKGIDTAVKQLDRNGFQGNSEFLVEVLVLSLSCHPNLVNLVGYCAENKYRILVYEYMPNGSLEDHLLNEKPLDWKTRMKIAQGAAKGLEYLHETVDPPVIYRDFKASNILLDANFTPKLSDFGLAKIGPVNKSSHGSTRVMGTYGYCAPEYACTGRVTTKSDVYSFGVVFMEMISGRRVVDTSRRSEEQNLITWVRSLFKDKAKFHLLADPLLEGNYPSKGLYQALAICAMCLEENSDARPSMTDVVSALEYLSTNNKNEEEEQEEEGHNDDDDCDSSTSDEEEEDDNEDGSDDNDTETDQ